jgi:hypothetical protein
MFSCLAAANGIQVKLMNNEQTPYNKGMKLYENMSAYSHMGDIRL